MNKIKEKLKYYPKIKIQQIQWDRLNSKIKLILLEEGVPSISIFYELFTKIKGWLGDNVPRGWQYYEAWEEAIVVKTLNIRFWYNWEFTMFASWI